MSMNLSAISYTPAIISSQLVQNISLDESQQATLEQELSSGNLVNQPSDNPAAASSIMQLNSSVARAKQYASNAADGLGWLSLANSTLNSVMSNLQSAHQLVLSLSGSTLSGQKSAVTGISEQLKSITNQILSLANTQYGNQAIFSGTGNPTQAYDSNGKYIGGGRAPVRTVAAGVQIPVSLTGEQIFGSQTSPKAGQPALLGPTGVLNTLVGDINSGNLQKAETTDLGQLTQAMQNVAGAAATLGAYYQQMHGFAAQATNTQTALQSQVSAEDSVNVAQATTQLTQAQQTFQTGLWATAQIESHSLVQYL